jgi:O-antigen/teichoic acid export membrane protein
MQSSIDRWQRAYKKALKDNEYLQPIGRFAISMSVSSIMLSLIARYIVVLAGKSAPTPGEELLWLLGTVAFFLTPQVVLYSMFLLVEVESASRRIETEEKHRSQ